MTGKRQEKKRILRKKILDAAKKVFIQNGFNNTTIEQIANEAEVGLGTTYNYFSSKSELFIATMGDIFKIENYENFMPNYELDFSVYDTISTLAVSLIQTFVAMDKKLLRELFSVFMGNMDTENKMLAQGLMEFDYKFIDQLKNLLIEFQDAGKLKSEFDVLSGVYIIYSIVMQIFISILFMEDIPYESHIKNMKSQLKLVISPYEV